MLWGVGFSYWHSWVAISHVAGHNSREPSISARVVSPCPMLLRDLCLNTIRLACVTRSHFSHVEVVSFAHSLCRNNWTYAWWVTEPISHKRKQNPEYYQCVFNITLFWNIPVYLPWIRTLGQSDIMVTIFCISGECANVIFHCIFFLSPVFWFTSTSYHDILKFHLTGF